ncbi:conserved membrane hypothetical protein [Candidatus Sulfopaludibacter sp. SbA3]|nr:conserved membrane hypothetical protein [Candidatus Sulfopaludibacter sp. SbA3]
MNTGVRLLVGLLLFAILIAAGIAIIHAGGYGLTLFVTFPVLLGGVASWVFRPATHFRALMLGVLAAAVASVGLLLLRLDGLICIVMALPLTAPLAALGSWLVYQAEPSGRIRRGLGILLMLPPGMLWDAAAPPPVFEVHTSLVINAPPEKIWKYVVSFPPLPEPHEWYFRAGLAYPTLTRIEGSGAGATRYCEFSTGPVVEPIEVWDEARLLRFRVTESPAPMHELSPYAQVEPKHLHGYLVSKEGQFLLTPLDHGRTLVEGTSWYQHGLWPAGYWRVWSDAIIHRIHLRVLHHIKTLAEKQ